MDQTQQIVAFENDLEKLIIRYSDEFDLSYAAVIGVLHIQIHTLAIAALEDDEPEKN